MKILSIMCDMVRPDVLDFNNCPSESFEQSLINIGGTFYSNCFSQGPDTGRSMGCFWSGKQPQENGCDQRIKYPKFYMKDNGFLDVLYSLGYQFYFFSNPNEKVLGILPEKFEQQGIHNTDLDLKKYAGLIDTSNTNLYVHFALTDFHWALDDYGANKAGVSVGLRILKEALHIIRSELDLNEFDLIFIFSDHGFKYDTEFKYQEKYLFLDRSRSNVCMFIHQKGQQNFTINNKLSSLIDVYPTLMEKLNLPYCGHGYSFFSPQEPEFIISEDHLSFLPEVNQRIGLWAMIKKEVIYLRTISGHYRDDGEIFELDKDNFDHEISEYSVSFKETYKQLKIMALYQTMATDKSFYTIGESRHNKAKDNIIRKMYVKARNFIDNIKYKNSKL